MQMCRDVCGYCSNPSIDDRSFLNRLLPLLVYQWEVKRQISVLVDVYNDETCDWFVAESDDSQSAGMPGMKAINARVLIRQNVSLRYSPA